MVFYTFNDSILKGDGKSYVTGYWSQCFIMESIVLLTVLTKAIMVTEWLTIVTFIGIGIMITFHIAIMIGVNYILYHDDGSIFMIFHSPNVLLIIMFILVVNLLPDIVIL